MARRVLLSLMVLCPGAAAPLRADFLDFWTQCSVGALRACASVSLTSDYDPTGARLARGQFIPGGVTEIRIRLGNPQGLPGFKTEPRGLRWILINELVTESPSVTDYGIPRLSSTEGNVTHLLPDGFLDTASPVYTGTDWLRLLVNYDYDSALFGCDVPDQADLLFAGYDATCDGWVTYTTLLVGGEVNLSTETSLQLGWWAYEGGADAGHPSDVVWCTTGVDCQLITPEPVTVVLLASGLAALGGMGALRRRRMGPDDRM